VRQVEFFPAYGTKTHNMRQYYTKCAFPSDDTRDTFYWDGSRGKLPTEGTGGRMDLPLVLKQLSHVVVTSNIPIAFYWLTCWTKPRRL